MKILGLFLVPEIRTGGHVRYLELMEALARVHEVLVLFNPYNGYKPQHFTQLPLKIDFAAPGPRRKGTRMLAAVKQFVRARGADGERDRLKLPEPPETLAADVVLVFGETHLRAAVHLARAAGARLVYGSRHNSFRNTALNFLRDGLPLADRAREFVRLFVDAGYERYVARRAAALVFQSQYDRDDFLSRNPRAARISHIVQGDILQPRFKPEFRGANSCTDPSKLAFIGTLGTRKGLGVLLEAVRLLAERGLRVELKIAAAGSDFSRFAAFLHEHGLEDRVEFLGRIPEVLPLLASSGLLVVPSEFDSFPNVVLEAIHVGCPVIGSDSGGIPEILDYPDALFPPGNAAVIADKIELLQKDVGAYARLRAACERRRDAFSFDWAGKWLKIMETEENA